MSVNFAFANDALNAVLARVSGLREAKNALGKAETLQLQVESLNREKEALLLKIERLNDEIRFLRVRQHHNTFAAGSVASGEEDDNKGPQAGPIRWSEDTTEGPVGLRKTVAEVAGACVEEGKCKGVSATQTLPLVQDKTEVSVNLPGEETDVFVTVAGGSFEPYPLSQDTTKSSANQKIDAAPRQKIQSVHYDEDHPKGPAGSPAVPLVGVGEEKPRESESEMTKEEALVAEEKQEEQEEAEEEAPLCANGKQTQVYESIMKRRNTLDSGCVAAREEEDKEPEAGPLPWSQDRTEGPVDLREIVAGAAGACGEEEKRKGAPNTQQYYLIRPEAGPLPWSQDTTEGSANLLGEETDVVMRDKEAGVSFGPLPSIQDATEDSFDLPGEETDVPHPRGIQHGDDLDGVQLREPEETTKKASSPTVPFDNVGEEQIRESDSEMTEEETPEAEEKPAVQSIEKDEAEEETPLPVNGKQTQEAGAIMQRRNTVATGCVSAGEEEYNKGPEVGRFPWSQDTTEDPIDLRVAAAGAAGACGEEEECKGESTAGQPEAGPLPDEETDVVLSDEDIVLSEEEAGGSSRPFPLSQDTTEGSPNFLGGETDVAPPRSVRHDGGRLREPRETAKEAGTPAALLTHVEEQPPPESEGEESKAVSTARQSEAGPLLDGETDIVMSDKEAGGSSGPFPLSQDITEGSPDLLGGETDVAPPRSVRHDVGRLREPEATSKEAGTPATPLVDVEEQPPPESEGEESKAVSTARQPEAGPLPDEETDVVMGGEEAGGSSGPLPLSQDTTEGSPNLLGGETDVAPRQSVGHDGGRLREPEATAKEAGTPATPLVDVEEQQPRESEGEMTKEEALWLSANGKQTQEAYAVTQRRNTFALGAIAAGEEEDNKGPKDGPLLRKTVAEAAGARGEEADCKGVSKTQQYYLTWPEAGPPLSWSRDTTEGSSDVLGEETDVAMSEEEGGGRLPAIPLANSEEEEELRKLEGETTKEEALAAGEQEAEEEALVPANGQSEESTEGLVFASDSTNTARGTPALIREETDAVVATKAANSAPALIQEEIDAIVTVAVCNDNHRNGKKDGAESRPEKEAFRVVKVNDEEHCCEEAVAAVAVVTPLRTTLSKKRKHISASSSGGRHSSPKKWRRMIRTHRLQSYWFES